MSATAFKLFSDVGDSLNHQNFGFFGLVPKPPIDADQIFEKSRSQNRCTPKLYLDNLYKLT